MLIQNHDDAPSTNVPLPPHPIALKLYTKDAPEWTDLGLPIPASHSERIASVPRSFIDMLRNDTEPTITAKDGRVSVEMVLGAYQSAAEGRRVEFPL